jgi:hypothetical protein
MRVGALEIYLLNVIIGHEAYWFVVIVGTGFLLGLPPAVIVVVVEDVEQVAFIDGQFALRLRRVVVDGPVHAPKPHVAYSWFSALRGI